MKKSRIIIAMLAILVIIMPFALMACKKDTNDNSALTWDKVLKTDFAAATRDIDYSQVDELSIPLLDPVKDYVVVTKPISGMNVYSDIIVFYEDTPTITSLIIYNYKTNTSATYSFTEAVDPTAMTIAWTTDDLLIINNTVTNVNVIINSSGTQIVKVNAEIEYKEELNLFIINDVCFTVKDGTFKRIGIDLEKVTESNRTNGFIQVKGAKFALIYSETGEIVASYFKPDSITNATYLFLDNGDIIVVENTEVTKPDYRDLDQSEYDIREIDGGETKYNKVSYKYMSASNKSVTSVSYDFVPYFYIQSEMVYYMTNTVLNDDYIGIILGLEINEKWITKSIDGAHYYAVKKDGTIAQIHNYSDMQYSSVRLIATDTFVFNYEDYIAFINAKGEFINSFYYDSNDDIIGSYYVMYPGQAIYSLDGTPKYEFLEGDLIQGYGDNFVIIRSGETLKFIYKTNNVVSIDVTDYNYYIPGGIVLMEKDGSTSAYKVDGSLIKTVETTFEPTNMYILTSGVIAHGENGKYYSVK